MNNANVYIIMGVSGSGKTTIGRLLAKRLDCPFYDGDDFHPAENVAKMADGTPLTDADRVPWLDRLHKIVTQHLRAGESAVIACSALKESYRDRLRGEHERVQFVHLHGSFELIWQRMEHRKNHFMKSEMLQSQFKALEMPDAQEALIVKIDDPPKAIVEKIIDRIN